MGQAHSTKLDRDTTSTMASEKTGTGYFPVQELPDEILGEVLLRLPAADLVTSCVRVCRRWRDVLNSQTLWKEKCRRDYHYTDQMLIPVGDFKQHYFKNPYNKNLIKNPCAIEGLTQWKIICNGGHGWKHEAEPCGSHPVKNYARIDSCGPIGCWVTSFGECMKEQEIDLVSRGCSPEILDNVRPDICVSEWYAARFDCPCEYKIKVLLLNEEKRVLERYRFADSKPAGRDWFQQSHVFTSYRPGCRYIKIIHGGKDGNWWAGHYGVKITLSTLKFDFSHTAGPFEGELELPDQEV